MVYQWKNGTRFNADAQKVGEEVKAIGPEVTPVEVVKAARKAKSAMHDCFEWDDTAAAEEYRLEQARLVLRSIVVISEGGGEQIPSEVRAYESVSLSDEDGMSRRVYVPTETALADDDMRAQVFRRLQDTISEARATIKKYSALIGAVGTKADKHLEHAAKVLQKK